MTVHRSLDQLPVFRNAVITIGTFDGVHSGHKQIINQLKEEAHVVNGETVIITFNPHPRKILQNQLHEVNLINTLSEKIELLEIEGIDHLVIVPFTKSFSDQQAGDYIENFLVKYFHPHTIIIGYDHHFGRNREGNYQLLEAMKEKYNYKVKEIPKHVWKKNIISSTNIRNAIINGDIETANDCLGYDYFFEGVVIEGNKLGKTIGYPTANICINNKEKLIPANGVYAVGVVVEHHKSPDNLLLKGMMNIGTRPTVGGTKQTIEVNIFDFDEDIYGRTLRIYVKKYLRSEIKFSGLEALKVQLGKDKQNALY